MAYLDFYIDTFRKTLVSGVLSSGIVQVPRFSQGDTYTLRIRALAQTVNFPVSNPPYTFIPNAGRTIQLAVGSPSTHLTEQYTWNLNPDPADPYFYADVAFNTPNVATALGSLTTVPSVMEIKLVDGTPKTILRAAVNIDASIIANTALTVPAGLTPVSMESLLAMLQNLTVGTLTIQSPDKTHSRVLGEGNDGSPSDTQLS